MEHFFEALISKERHKEIPESLDFFGKLLGSWKIDYVNNATLDSIKGEWHFSWILEGAAIQDVIVLPEFECGTTIRVYNPNKQAWDVVYCFAGKIIRLEAKKQGETIVLTNVDDERRKWVFAKIEDDCFHWHDVTVEKNGEWRVKFDIYAERA